MDLELPAWLPDWCRSNFGATPVRTLLRVEQMSQVFGVRLSSGLKIVVKARPDPSGRTTSCVVGQRYAYEHGFPCAEPLTDIVMIGELAVHAERWRPGGEMLRGDTPEIAVHFGVLLATLMAAFEGLDVAPPLPNPMWVDWDHPGTGIWPEAEFLDARDQSPVPDFVRETAQRAAARIVASHLPRVIGHADWETQNLRWRGTTPWIVYDFDSLAWMSEAAIAGAACGGFASAEVPTIAPLRSSAAFLEAYQDRRGRRFTPEEIEVAWAASLWPPAHNARAQAIFARPPVAVPALAAQYEQRLALAAA